MYKVSENYPRLKELLDSGERIVCYIDFTIDLSSGEKYTFRDIAEAIRWEEACKNNLMKTVFKDGEYVGVPPTLKEIRNRLNNNKF